MPLDRFLNNSSILLQHWSMPGSIVRTSGYLMSAGGDQELSSSNVTGSGEWGEGGGGGDFDLLDKLDSVSQTAYRKADSRSSGPVVKSHHLSSAGRTSR
ncbi:hypothetical protein RRG08_010855 [Elysia crispata]|uniref:Uncharacterized protein n=1 Tax=Elysia crispata TaxID=231223 RepID=A0AAE0XTZ0_9GAST|nr:hypothetical protein RRG08_010855 [Elysia crispata]